MFQHVILTRFSCAFRHRTPQGGWEIRPPDQEWIAQRLDLFERYCLRSIERQTCKAFIWVLLCHPTTPTDVLTRLTALVAGLNGVVLLFDGLPLGSGLARTLDEQLSLGSQPTITTRLDSDDALAPGFVETVQAIACATREHPILISCPYGILWDDASRRAYWAFGLGNPFLSLVTPSHAFDIVLAEASRKIKYRFPIAIGPRRSMFVQVIHGRNVLNRVHRLRYPMSARQVRTCFPFLPFREARSSLLGTAAGRSLFYMRVFVRRFIRHVDIPLLEHYSLVRRCKPGQILDLSGLRSGMNEGSTGRA
jgi:hypothetical protein